MEIGRVCLKIAGRDAGQICAIQKILDDNHVMIVGPNVRNRKCSIIHLEPMKDVLDMSKDPIEQLNSLSGKKVKKTRKKKEE